VVKLNVLNLIMLRLSATLTTMKFYCKARIHSLYLILLITSLVESVCIFLPSRLAL
jgi:hypothetical protein